MKPCQDRYEGQLRANVYGYSQWFVVDLHQDRIAERLDDDDRVLTAQTAKAIADGMNAILNQQRERHGRCQRKR